MAKFTITQSAKAGECYSSIAVTWEGEDESFAADLAVTLLQEIGNDDAAAPSYEIATVKQEDEPS